MKSLLSEIKSLSKDERRTKKLLALPNVKIVKNTECIFYFEPKFFDEVMYMNDYASDTQEFNFAVAHYWKKDRGRYAVVGNDGAYLIDLSDEQSYRQFYDDERVEPNNKK